MVAIDEAFFLKHTDVVLPIVKVRGRALIVMSSTTSDVEVEGNPLPREALSPVDDDGCPTLRAVYALRCAPCARTGAAHCAHVLDAVPWKPGGEAADAENDVQLVVGDSVLLSADARARLLRVAPASLGPPVAGAPIAVGIDPGAGASFTAGVALRLHARGAVVVGLLASTRTAASVRDGHLADAAEFVARVAQQHGGAAPVVVYIEKNLAAAATAIAGLVAEQRTCAYVMRPRGCPVSGYTTGPRLPAWFADMLHRWLALEPALALEPRAHRVGVHGAGRGPLAVGADAHAALEGLLVAQLGCVHRAGAALEFKKGGPDDLFFALGMALRAAILAAPPYAAGNSATPPGAPDAAQLRGLDVVPPSALLALYADPLAVRPHRVQNS